MNLPLLSTLPHGPCEPPLTKHTFASPGHVYVYVCIYCVSVHRASSRYYPIRGLYDTCFFTGKMDFLNVKCLLYPHTNSSCYTWKEKKTSVKCWSICASLSICVSKQSTHIPPLIIALRAFPDCKCGLTDRTLFAMAIYLSIYLSSYMKTNFLSISCGDSPVRKHDQVSLWEKKHMTASIHRKLSLSLMHISLVVVYPVS